MIYLVVLGVILVSIVCTVAIWMVTDEGFDKWNQ
jgi:hypothetical protein